MTQFSHKNTPINIFIKEDSVVYLEDSKIFLVNITKISISTYNTQASREGEVTVVTTDFEVEQRSSKAGLHLVENLDFDLDSEVIGPEGTEGEEGLTEYELGLVGREGDSFQVVRGGLEIENLKVNRLSQVAGSGNFIFAIYQQQKEVTLSKSTFGLRRDALER